LRIYFCLTLYSCLVFFLYIYLYFFFQAVLFALVRPLSINLYRRINKLVAELLWLEIIWLIDWWAGVKRAGCLGSSLAIMKKSAKRLPSGFQRLEDFPVPFWLALFVEGTRFTQEKLLAAQKYAASRGLPVLKNVLIPRTKGFVSAVNHMRTFVPAVYDCTVVVSKNQPQPTMLRIFRRQSSVIKVQLRRHSMEELPETVDGIAKWCQNIFVAKDALLERYFCKGTFSDLKQQDIGRPIKSLIVVISWICVLIYGIVASFQWSSFLSSWEGIACSAIFLVVVTIVMQVLIQFSESNRSTPPVNRVAQEPTEERLLHE
ncbi:1-acyl-sn-glycerol-3-phosphate acyltransferase 3, partial [Morella rubra]